MFPVLCFLDLICGFVYPIKSMLMLKFQRVGRTNDPAFRIVVTEKRSKPKSGEHEILGSFHPKTKQINLKKERILYWLSVGAKATPRVHNLLVSNKVVEGKKIPIKIAKSPEAKIEKQTTPQP